MSNGVLNSSFNQGMKRAENLKEKPKYMLFSVLTVLVYEYAFGWIGVLTWFFINFIIDAILMYREGEI